MSSSSPTCSRMYITFGDEGGGILKWVETRFTNLGYGIAVGLLGAARQQMRLYVAAPQQLRRIIYMLFCVVAISLMFVPCL